MILIHPYKWSPIDAKNEPLEQSVSQAWWWIQIYLKRQVFTENFLDDLNLKHYYFQTGIFNGWTFRFLRTLLEGYRLVSYLCASYDLFYDFKSIDLPIQILYYRTDKVQEQCSPNNRILILAYWKLASIEDGWFGKTVVQWKMPSSKPKL